MLNEPTPNAYHLTPIASHAQNLADSDLASRMIHSVREKIPFQQQILDRPTHRIDGRIVAYLERLRRDLISEIEHAPLLPLR